MKAIISLVCAVVLILILMASPASGSDDKISEHFKLFGQYRKISQSTTQDKLAFIEKLSALPEISEAVSAEIDLLKVRLLINMDKNDEAIPLIEKYTTSYQKVMPEWYYMNIKILLGKNHQESYTISEYTSLVKDIPFSRIAIDFDKAHSENTNRIIRGLGWFVPQPTSLEPNTLVIISELYAANNMLNRARDMNLVMLYSCYPSPTTTDSLLNNTRRNYWDISEEDALAAPLGESLWRFVGQVERRNKNEKLALIAFLRAAYDQPETAEKLYQEWLKKDWFSDVKDKQHIDAKMAQFIAGQFSNLTYLHDEYPKFYGSCFFPWSLDALRESEEINAKLLTDYINGFKILVQQQVDWWGEDYRYLGVPAKDITDYENLHIPTPSETFWREDLLYVPKK